LPETLKRGLETGRVLFCSAGMEQETSTLDFWLCGLVKSLETKSMFYGVEKAGKNKTRPGAGFEVAWETHVYSAFLKSSWYR
jgi:hypothetical protein